MRAASPEREYELIWKFREVLPEEAETYRALDAAIKCDSCSTVKWCEEFPEKDRLHKIVWRHTICTSCAQEKKLHFPTPEETEALRKARKKANYQRVNHKRLWLAQIKQRAKKRGLAFDLSEEDLIIPERCPVLGIPIAPQFGSGKGSQKDNSPSVDRVDNSKGYVRGNVRVISNRANRLKNNANLEEIKQIATYVSAALR